MSVDILGTSCDQCRSMVQYSFTSTETRRLVRTDSPGRPPRLSHSSWTMSSVASMYRDSASRVLGCTEHTQKCLNLVCRLDVSSFSVTNVRHACWVIGFTWNRTSVINSVRNQSKQNIIKAKFSKQNTSIGVTLLMSSTDGLIDSIYFSQRRRY